MTASTCRRCGQPTSTRQVEAASSRGALTVRLVPVTVTTCPEGHRDVAPGTDQLVPLIREQLTIARRRLLRRGDRCGECGADLIMPARVTETPVPVVAGGEVVTVLLECPMVRCSDCGREQVPSHANAVLESAVAAALADGGA